MAYDIGLERGDMRADVPPENDQHSTSAETYSPCWNCPKAANVNCSCDKLKKWIQSEDRPLPTARRVNK